MHPRVIAQRQSDAHGRIVAAVQAIATITNGGALDLAAIREKSPDVQRVKEYEALADWLEGLAATIAVEPPTLAETMAAASVEQLSAIPGIGEATAKRIKAEEAKANE